MPPKVDDKHPNQELIQIDTTNILFILGGAFDGIDEVIKRREKAIERKTGAREEALRLIEEALIDIMYDVPSSEDVTKVVITDKTINDEVDPELYDSEGNLLNDSKTSA